ncbi:7-carboxy-7-deazaguanine synthase [uncultured archaeon]|nr:7-carboxy-7-deazaguanine synthase [uncultured archaeon]
MIKECVLYKKEGDNVRCLACSHKCIISEGRSGICGVRKNISGKLILLVYGKISSLGIDPIEKKPLNHFLPGTKTYSIGTVGCNFKCDWCQNYDLSQNSKEAGISGEEMTPEKVVSEAIRTKCKSISYTYNEPVIFIEFVKDCAILARKKGLKNILVTNGYFSKESFDFIADYIDAMNIDLKCFNDRDYIKYCGGNLQPVLDTIKKSYENGIYLEITTLVIPGINDSQKELTSIAKFISSIDKKIPWHVNRFFPMYNMVTTSPTSIESLEKAYKIGRKYLDNVHLGNI